MSGSPQPPEDLVEEFLRLRRAGQGVEARAFAARHGEAGPELLAALEALELLEGLAPGLGALDAGAVLDRYRLTRLVGRGGMGLVWEADDVELGRRVALKLLPAELLASPPARARFRREAELAARLEHPALCAVHGAGVHAGRPWIAMRFVEGETLAALIAAARARGEARVSLPGSGAEAPPLGLAALVGKLARALEAAHARGIVHRDVKPSNVMVTPAGEPVLLDFGLAREAESDGPALTRSGDTAGTPGYLAPELLDGTLRHPDPETDVYALGVTLYEALALERPFQGPTRDALYREILQGTPPSLARRGLSRDLAVVALTALERERRHRYASAGALAADLEAVVAGRPIAARPVGPLGRALRWARRAPGQAALAGTLLASAVCAALLGGAVLASRDEVQAAERDDRAREAERALKEGFSCLTDDLYDEADAEFARAQELDPAGLEPRAGRVLVSLARGRDDEALERLADAPPAEIFERLRRTARGEPVADDPAFVERATSVELFLESQRLSEAAASLPPSQRPEAARRALELVSEAVLRAPAARALYHVQRANAAIDAGDAAAARSEAEALLVLWPDSFREMYVAGSALLEVDPARALPLLARAAELEPRHPGALGNLGTARVLLGDAAGAETAFRAALALDDVLPDLHNGLGLALGDLGRPDEARAEFRRALELHPLMVDAWSNLGNLEGREENYAACAAALARAVELDPTAVTAQYRCGWASALYSLDDFDAAEEQYRAALDLDPDLVCAWSGLAWTLLEKGEPAEALQAAERGLERFPDEPELLEVQARIREVPEEGR